MRRETALGLERISQFLRNDEPGWGGLTSSLSRAEGTEEEGRGDADRPADQRGPVARAPSAEGAPPIYRDL
jgi:hypothetical protein